MPILEGTPLQKLWAALKDAYSVDEMRGFIRRGLSVEIDDLSSEVKPRAVRFFEIVEVLDGKGRGCELLAACAAQADSPSLRALAEELAEELCRQGAAGGGANPLEACVVNRRPFVNREPLRAAMEDFETADERLLLIKGSELSGKSHSWHFIKHLAAETGSARPLLFDLKKYKGEGKPTPDELMDTIAKRLDLGKEDWPTEDRAQGARRAEKLADWLVGKSARLDRPFWLVIDHLDKKDIGDGVLELAVRLAEDVDSGGLENISLVLIDFPQALPPALEPFVLLDQAESFDTVEVKSHFRTLAEQLGHDIADAKVESFAAEVFEGLARPFGRNEMYRITGRLAKLSKQVVEGKDLA